MYTEYGFVEYIGETSDLTPIYVYGIKGIFIKAAIYTGKPYVSIIKTTKSGRQYFIKDRRKVYIDKLEKINVI